MFNIKDNKSIGYHLFILPSGEPFTDLQNTINALAEKYDGPKFEPHVTLLAKIPKSDEVELIAKTKKLAGTMRPFEVALDGIGAEDAYFRSLYCKVQPNAKLDDYHQKALEIFSMEDVNKYMPHLSLYYGNIPQTVKDEMIKSLSLTKSTKFLVGTMCLYRTEGEAEDWVRVGSYLFGE